MCKDIFKVNLEEIEPEIVDWIEMAQDVGQRRPVMNRIVKLRVLEETWKFAARMSDDQSSRTNLLRGVSEDRESDEDA